MNIATRLSRVPRERNRTGCSGLELVRVGAPFGLEHARGRNLFGNDARLGRDDQIGGAALPLAPAAQRLHDEGAIDPLLRRSRIVDDRRIDLEDRERADPARGENAFAAEVVVALDDDIGLESARGRAPFVRAANAAGDRRTAAASRTSAPSCRHRAVVSRRHEHVHIMSEFREPLCNSRHMYPNRHGQQALIDRWRSTESSSGRSARLQPGPIRFFVVPGFSAARFVSS